MVTLLAIIQLEDILTFCLKKKKSIKAIALPQKKPFIFGMKSLLGLPSFTLFH